MKSTGKVVNLINKTQKDIGCDQGYSVGINLDPEQSTDGRPNGAFGGGGAAGTVSRAAPLVELTMVYMVRQRSDLHVKFQKCQ